MLKIKNLSVIAALAGALVVGVPGSGHAASGVTRFPKLDNELARLAASGNPREKTSVIVRLTPGASLPNELKPYARGGKLDIVNGYVLDVPNSQLKTIAQHASTAFASLNGTVHASNFRTSVQSGAFFANRLLGFTGAGVGVAILDSGVAPVEDLTAWEGVGRAPGRSRITYFQDFLVPDPLHVGQETLNCSTPCDYSGHGTHVAGTIAGNGYDSFGQKAGMAPDASLVALRVLGKDGSGSLDGVLNALQWVLLNAKAKNIRIVNLAFGMAPVGSLPADGSIAGLLNDDPLALATKRLVDAGIFVVGAGGNIGQIDCASAPGATPDPKTGKCDAWGGITAPGTYPWVFTAGANSSHGSVTRGDDTRASFSSRGPAFPLQNAKPDLLAGGVGIESLTAGANSSLYQSAQNNGFLINGSFPTATSPYMALSGTSQSTAVVSGVAALMLQANPKLTPNLMKAILQYTAQDYAGNDPLEQGAGFLNALGAVRLSHFYATARRGQHVPVEPIWSKHIIWGNHMMSGGFMLPNANAWGLGVVWGYPHVAGDTGDNIIWGTSCGSDDCGDNIIWGTSNGDNIIWGTADGDNIIWGTSGDGDNIIWGTADDGDNIIWGTDDIGDNIIWGTDDNGDNIIWGTDDNGDNIIWGTADGDNIIWGTADGDNIIWGTDGDNIIWGTDGDNIIWGTDGDNIIWGTLNGGHRPTTQDEWFRLFLNRRFDIVWIAHEFGDQFFSRDGHPVVKPATHFRVRKPAPKKAHK